MKKIIAEAINEIYVNKNYKLFSEKCRQYLPEVGELAGVLSRNYEVDNSGFDDEMPCDTLYIKYNSYTDGNITIKYQSIINICKIIKIFYVQHEFSLDNTDPDKSAPVLDGYGGMPYTKTQYIMELSSVEFLEALGYEKIGINELDEAVCDIPLPEGSIFGKQLTVENALFRDVLGVNESE